MTIIRRYSELARLETFEERYEYLRLGGSVGASTFGFDRYLNQGLYHSKEWKDVRREVIIRDNGCDLAVEGFGIHGGMLVHHMNPLQREDILEHDPDMLDPQYLITTCQATHNAIHYGDKNFLKTPFVPRERGDTKLW